MVWMGFFPHALINEREHRVPHCLGLAQGGAARPYPAQDCCRPVLQKWRFCEVPCRCGQVPPGPPARRNLLRLVITGGQTGLSPLVMSVTKLRACGLAGRFPMFLRLAAACLIFPWTAGLAAEAEQCHGNPEALGSSRVITLDTSEHCDLGFAQFDETLPALYTPRVFANGDYPKIATKAEQWAAGNSARWAEWPSPWLVQVIRSSLLAANAEPAAKAEQWAITLEAPAGTSARSAEWASPWLVQAIPSSLPAAKTAHASASKLSTVSMPGSNAIRHLGPRKIASLSSRQE
jgi:hypothetical protein